MSMRTAAAAAGNDDPDRGQHCRGGARAMAVPRPVPFPSAPTHPPAPARGQERARQTESLGKVMQKPNDAFMNQETHHIDRSGGGGVGVGRAEFQ